MGIEPPAIMPLHTMIGRLLVILLVLALAAAVWQLIDVAMLLFGAILLAVGLTAAAAPVARIARIGQTFALGVVVVLGLGVFATVMWLFGSVVVAQMDDVRQIAPAGLKLLLERINENPYGRQAMEQARGVNVTGATGWATSLFATILGAVTRGLGYAVVTFFVAIYLAAQPARYRHFCLRLVPEPGRATTERLFDETAAVLRHWLAGQMVVMAAIGVLSGLGLWLLGIEAAFALGLMGGLLCFIPYVGAIMAAVPATLVALTQGPLYAGSVILMYAAVHFVEGNFITPMVQAETTALPPVLAILSTVAFSVLFGPSAVLLAAPLTLFLLVAVEVLYVQQALGEAPEKTR